MSALRHFALLLAAAASLLGQEQQYAMLGDFKLESGEVIRNCRIGYRLFGKLNDAKSNAVLFPTWFTGASEDLAAHIGSGNLADSSKYFVIAVDALGNGVSSSPSNSQLQPRMNFPKFTIRDMVNSQYQLVTRTLGLQRLFAVVGISMGGMQTFEWAVAHPDFLRYAVPIVSSPQLTSYDLLLWTAEAHAIENDPQWQSGNYSSPLSMKVVHDIHNLALTTPAQRIRETPRGQFSSFLKTVEEPAKPKDANDWLLQLNAMLRHDVARSYGGSLEKAAAAVHAKLMAVVVLEDHMVNPATSIRFANLMKAQTLEIASDCGHLAVGCEKPRISIEISRFLAGLPSLKETLKRRQQQ